MYSGFLVAEDFWSLEEMFHNSGEIAYSLPMLFIVLLKHVFIKHVVFVFQEQPDGV